jgi:hypothetical protein
MAIGTRASVSQRFANVGGAGANPQPEYRKQAMSFVRAVQGLREAAAKRDIDAALAEYTELVFQAALGVTRMCGDLAGQAVGVVLLASIASGTGLFGLGAQTPQSLVAGIVGSEFLSLA